MLINKKSRFLFAVSPLIIAGSAMASTPEGLNPPGGFIDPQFQYDQNDGSSISVVDSAVYLTKSFGNASAMVDLPVLTSNPDKLQAWVSYKFENGLSWKIGKFDGIFGLERNDTAALELSNQGLTYGLQPVSHNALMLGYALGEGLDVSAYADVAGTAPQYGAKVAYKGAFRLAAGGYYNTDAADGTTQMFMNGSAGIDAAGMAIDAEYSMKTPAGDGAISESGIGAHVGYGLSDTTKIAGRFTMLSNADGVDGASKMQITAGPSFAVTKDLTVKVDGDYMIQDAGNAAKFVVTSTLSF